MLALLSFYWLILQWSTPPATLPTCAAPPPICAAAPIPEGILFSSADGGKSWINRGTDLPADLVPFTFSSDNAEMYLVAADGIYRSPTSLPAQSWNKDLVAPKGITSIFPGKDGPYAVIHENGFYQYQHASDLWKPMGRMLKDKAIYTLFETASGVLFVGGESGLYRSKDKGKSWQHCMDKSPVYRLTEVQDAVILCSPHGLLRSTDEGENWQRVLTNVSTPFQVQNLGEEVFTILDGQEIGGIRTPNAVYKSTDSGASWESMATQAETGNINEFAKIGQTLFASSHLGIIRSDDRGKTWHSVLLNPANKGGLYKLVVSENILIALFVDGC